MKLSIRSRLTLWYAGVLLLGLALFGFGTWFALQKRLLAGADERLAQCVQGVQKVVEIESADGARQLQIELAEFADELADGNLIQIRDSAGALLLPSAPGWLTPPPVHPGRPYETVNRNGKVFRILSRRFTYGTHAYGVVVAMPLDEIRSVMRVFRGLLLAIIPAVLAAACLGGYWISGRALAPVDRITRVAKSISVDNLSKRLEVPQTGDELQRMSQAWNEVLERLEGAVGRIRQFTADASHELRTPLALISATAELALRRERQPEEYRASLREIGREAERIALLTESLLVLARADANNLDMPLAPIDVNAVVAGVVRGSATLAAKKGIVLRQELAGAPAIAKGNEGGMRRLLLILIDNALKHTPPGGSVTVSTSAGGEELVLSVRDSGEGIQEHDLPHIFDRFYRADPSRGESGGAGLGLSIAQTIARAHASTILVTSTPGCGSCFSMKLQRGMARPQRPEPISPPARLSGR